MSIDIPTSIAIAGLLIAFSLGLPSILAFWREKRSQDGIYGVLDRIESIQQQVDDLGRRAELTTSCFEKLNSAILVQRSAFSELIRNADANWTIADRIFYEKDLEIRRALLHLQLESKDREIRWAATHSLATELGNAKSILHMQKASAGLDDIDKKVFEKSVKQLTSRIN
ncbi:hypothetical protein [Sulfitobacter geojensis]|uniref:hypothetical protein n=1 Tax=Sulfitobacter geojensis TaxID=1342299 RepID=UPI00046A64EF|nr:hypothetical protein [Sulfitobacter geojensis]NYI28219.1 hypothetical protein [Sulfitobacter geojensis]